MVSKINIASANQFPVLSSQFSAKLNPGLSSYTGLSYLTLLTPQHHTPQIPCHPAVEGSLPPTLCSNHRKAFSRRTVAKRLDAARSSSFVEGQGFSPAASSVKMIAGFSR
jgi:hypothetical protein